MAAHNEKGKAGEQSAVDYFSEKGYEILHRNWRHRHWEIDLVVSKENVLHFIEVKCRSSNTHGFPEENVSMKKIRHLIDASAEFLYQFPKWQRVQFDVLSVCLPGNGVAEFFLIEDVYVF